jgi:hypothetical protein
MYIQYLQELPHTPAHPLGTYVYSKVIVTHCVCIITFLLFLYFVSLCIVGGKGLSVSISLLV